jgi:hypothetical protein
VGEESAGATAADGDLVADQMHLVVVAQAARARRRYSGSYIAMPLAHWISGSTISAAMRR